jgi:hypothetical protein
MAYDDIPRKPIEVREGDIKDYDYHDELIAKAQKAGDYCVRTDVNAEGVGYLGMDDIDRLRRRKLVVSN